MPADPPAPGVDLVIKLGGSLLHHAPLHARALAAIERLARVRRLLIVPGGGPFADVVRELDRELALGDDLAHWLAIGAMDLHARLIAARLPRASVVHGPVDAASAPADHALVLAALDWLRQVDPLPHSWDVTSDSIAAWVAGAIGAPHLVLVKSTEGHLEALTDPCLPRTLHPGLEVGIMSVPALEQLARQSR